MRCISACKNRSSVEYRENVMGAVDKLSLHMDVDDDEVDDDDDDRFCFRTIAAFADIEEDDGEEEEEEVDGAHGVVGAGSGGSLVVSLFIKKQQTH